MRLGHLPLPKINSAVPVRRPAAVIVTDYGLGLAITESDAICPHGSLLPQRDSELATKKSAYTRTSSCRALHRALLWSPKRKSMTEVPASARWTEIATGRIARAATR